jgi:hypothetical protein
MFGRDEMRRINPILNNPFLYVGIVPSGLSKTKLTQYTSYGIGGFDSLQNDIFCVLTMITHASKIVGMS